MARTLPWLKETSTPASTTHAKASTTRAPKRQRIQQPAADSDDASSTPARSSTPRRNASTRSSTEPPQTASLPFLLTFAPRSSHPSGPALILCLPDRTPSTSPPPAPPAIEPMRPGLAFDDIYIMVEDEFLSTARLYTQHLHHAEYVRLRRLAATRKSSPNGDSIARPVDSITEMREETKRRKEAEKHARKVKDGMERMVGAVEARQPVDAPGAEESEFEEEERMDAPGIGTVLGDLMKTGPKKGVGGLGGLAGVKSSTRAAAGFGRRDGLGKGGGKSRIEPIGTAVGRAADYALEVEEDRASTDDDDLDAPVWRQPKVSATGHRPRDSSDPRGPSSSRSLKQPTSSTTTLPPTGTKDLTNGSVKTTLKSNNSVINSSSAQAKASTLRVKPLKTSEDEGFARPSNPRTDAIRQRMQARRKREQEEEREGKEKSFDIDEIPVFLV
ncbi:MAG: hypothetical protein Q9195_001478 [Heterodermia aff. obscurata]